jgi:hypothetical protein
MEAVIEGYGLQPVHKEQNELWALAPEGMQDREKNKKKSAYHRRRSGGLALIAHHTVALLN